MRFLKKLFLYLLLILALSAGAMAIAGKFRQGNRSYVPFLKPCRTPLKYSIGEIDPRFNVTSEQLKNIIAESENVWEKEGGLDLFAYDAGAPLQIKMVYDERQQETVEADQMENDLKILENQRLTLDRQYSGLDREYDRKLAAFESALAAYEKKLKDYNKDVSYWNKKGGAPAGEYEKLKKEQKNLNETYDALKKQENELKKLASKINNVANKENSIVDSYNLAVTTYQNKYGEAQEFEKGVFDSMLGITIYQFRGMDDLRLTIIHELGHMLGLGHTQNPQSIMYYLMGEQNLENPTLVSEDVAELKNVCELN